MICRDCEYKKTVFGGVGCGFPGKSFNAVVFESWDNPPMWCPLEKTEIKSPDPKLPESRRKVLATMHRIVTGRIPLHLMPSVEDVGRRYELEKEIGIDALTPSIVNPSGEVGGVKEEKHGR